MQYENCHLGVSNHDLPNGRPWHYPLGQSKVTLYCDHWQDISLTLGVRLSHVYTVSNLVTFTEVYSVGGVKVSIVAFQAIDPGSIPG